MKDDKQINVIAIAVIERKPTKARKIPVTDGNSKIMSGVPTEEYAQGWTRIFGNKQEVGQA